MGVLVWAHLGLVGLAIPIALIDLRDHRLPDRLTLPLWGGSALVALAAERDVALHGMLSSALVVLFLLLAAEWPGRPLGYGDVKLGGGLALQLGWYGLEWAWWGLALGVFFGGIWALGALVMGKIGPGGQIPFGPWLLAGALVALAQAV